MPDVFSRTTPNWKPSLGFSADSSIPKWNILILWGNLLGGTKRNLFSFPDTCSVPSAIRLKGGSALPWAGGHSFIVTARFRIDK